MGSKQLVTTKLIDLCELIVDCPHSTPKWTDSGYIILRNQNIKNGSLDLSSPSSYGRSLPYSGGITMLLVKRYH